MTNRQRTLASLVLAVLLAALFAFGGSYRAVLVLFLPFGFWLSVRREPEQMQVRPWIRVLGWVFVGFAVAAFIWAVIALAGRR